LPSLETAAQPYSGWILSAHAFGDFEDHSTQHVLSTSSKARRSSARPIGRPTQYERKGEARFPVKGLRFSRFLFDNSQVHLYTHANAYAERFVRSIKEACLDRLIFFGEDSLRTAVREFVARYLGEPHHQGLGNQLIVPETSEPGNTGSHPLP
jgi:hypothetical protein